MIPPPRINVGGDHIRAVRFSKAGIAFILLTLGLGLAALNSGNNLLYLIFAMLLGMLAINAVLSRTSLARLTVTLLPPAHVYAQTPTPLRLELRNHKPRIASYALTLLPATTRKRFTAEGGFIFKLAPGGSETVLLPHTFARRGRQPLPDFTLLSSFPFGLIDKVIPVRPEAAITVLPRIDPVTTLPPLAAPRQGETLADRKGLGGNPYGVRLFQQGDEVRHMHWPSVAKMGALIVKEFEQEKRTSVTLHLITGPTPPPDADTAARREATISALASLLVALAQAQREVGLMINGARIAPGGAADLDRFLQTLALFDQPDSPAAPPPATRPARTRDDLILGFSELPRTALDPARYDRLVCAHGEPA